MSTEFESHSVLFIDDNENLLSAFKRQFRKRFKMATAVSAKDGLKLLAKAEFSVVVCDMNMPGMDGVAFFKEICSSSPDTVRIMLTGNADLDTAIHAVNEGNVFRFLIKPCSVELLESTVRAGIEQHLLIRAEQDILSRTVRGSIEVMTRTLELINPLAFCKAKKICGYAKQLAGAKGLSRTWEIEISSLLSQIGCVSIPPDILEKMYAGRELNEIEKSIYSRHPKVGSELLAHIPRLERVSMVVGCQNMPVAELEAVGGEEASTMILFTQILAVATGFESLISKGNTKHRAILELKRNPEQYSLTIVELLSECETMENEIIGIAVKVAQLEEGMMLSDNMLTRTGVMIASRGQGVNETLIALLSNYLERGFIVDEVRIQQTEENESSSSRKAKTDKTPRPFGVSI